MTSTTITTSTRVKRATGALLALALATSLAAACAEKADESPLGENTSDGSAGRNGGNSGEGEGQGDGAANVDWQDCGPGECAEVEVPVDYDDPDGETITLSVARAPATGERIGALFMNPGGPGALASEFAVGMATVMPSEVTEHFDIVGVDPRGLGASDFSCGMEGEEIYGVDYSIDSPEDETELLELSQEYVDGCEAAVGNLLPHLGTEDVARDIDAVREAMGDEQLNYLGYSYGTAIGQMLAELFPDRVRAMVIDGVLELGPTGVELAEAQSAGFESALSAFQDDCDSDPSCPLAPDAAGAVNELIDTVEEEPIPASPRDLGPGELAVGMASPLYSEEQWPTFASAIADALDGDGSGIVALADEYLAGDWDIYFAVNCLDFAWPDTPEELLADGAEAADEAPIFGEWIVNDYVRCSMWPAEADPLPAVTAPDAPPILVVSTTNDPATPYEAGVRTAERLESGVLLSYEGEGHTVTFNGVSCVDDAVTNYLVNLEPPEDGTTC
jgi:pimeloyl-ACP methyl ester carboxylesterase